MSRKFKIVFSVIVIFLQMTALAHVRFLGVVPNYIFLCIVAINLISPNAESVVLGAATGLLTDILSGSPLGLNTLLCMYGALACTLASDFVYNKSVKVMCPICFVISFAYEVLFGVSAALLSGKGVAMGTLCAKAAVVSAIGCVVFVPMYIILKRVKSEKKRKGIKYEQQTI